MEFTIHALRRSKFSQRALGCLLLARLLADQLQQGHKPVVTPASSILPILPVFHFSIIPVFHFDLPCPPLLPEWG
jgi:hypothetical protein